MQLNLIDSSEKAKKTSKLAPGAVRFLENAVLVTDCLGTFQKFKLINQSVARKLKIPRN